MGRSFFIPARNSRHRIAALALYRALIRTGRKIDLPQDAQLDGNVHHVAKIVRKRFEGNKNYTSLRLVYSSLAAGYKFLTMLTKAQAPESREYTEVVKHLRERIATSAASRSSRPPPPPKRDPLPPLLRNIAAPDEAPKYVAEPRAKETLPGQRRVPQLCATSQGQPFLRYKKPHPQVLNRMVGRKNAMWYRGIDNVAYAEAEMGPNAALEDNWENSIEELMREQQGRNSKTRGVEASDTYLWSAVVSKLWFEWRLERMWRDWNARGEAMHELVEKERDLVEKEKTDSGDAGLTPLSAIFETQPPEGPRSPEKPNEPKGLEDLEDPLQQPQRRPYSQSKVRPAAFPPMPALKSATETIAELKRKNIPIDEDKDDPFVSPVWAGVIEKQDRRLKKWMASTPNADPRYWAWKKQGQARYEDEDEELKFLPSRK